MKPGIPIADLTSGLWAAIALLAALRGRDASGQGAHVDLSMLDAQSGAQCWSLAVMWR